VTSEQLSLLPTSRDDRRAALRRLQLAAGGVLQLGERLGAEVRKRMALEPTPEVLDGVELGGVARQELDVDMALGRIDVLAHDSGAMGLGPVPDDEQRPAIVDFERLHEGERNEGQERISEIG